MEEPLSVVLECARTDTPEDPYAFRFEPQDYTLRSPRGTRERFRIEWSGALTRELLALRGPRRDPVLVQRLGELLRRSLMAAGWRELERQILATTRKGRRVHVTLRSNAAELFALPWELLTVGAGGQHLGELPNLVLRYEWPGADTTQASPSPRPEGARILLAWSAAGGSVPASEHIEAIESSCRSSHGTFEGTRDVLAHASARTLAEALERGTTEGEPYAVLHLLCCGGAARASFGLTLDDNRQDGLVLDAGRLRQLIAPHASTLRLVVITACDGGNVGPLGPRGKRWSRTAKTGERKTTMASEPSGSAGHTTVAGRS